MLELQFKLNDFQYFANSKMTIMQACLTNKIDVPRFCFHEQLSIAGNCRMCLVEDSKQFKPIASCAVDTSDSLGIYTNTAKVKKARESVLEFLLANHPLDCPICDQGGECDLQDQSIVFGSDRGRFYEFKRSVEDKNCGPLIKTIMNRCIHCTRRIRFGNEIAGVNLLGNTGRGSRMEIGSYTERLMKTELSGNVIDLCPVGALTSKPFSFTSRPWELKNYDSIDLLDSLHSNIRVDVRGTKIMRILPRVNNDVNGDWITDKIRFSYDSFHRQRLYGPMLKLKSSLVKVTWRKAFIFLKSHFLNILEAGLNRSLPLRLYPGNFIDFETTYMIRRFTSFTGSVSTVSGPVDNRFLYGFNTPISQIISADLCLLIGVNLRLSLPLVNSKIRQLSLKGNIPVYVIGSYSSFNYYTKHISSVSETILDICEGLHWLNSRISKSFSNRPVVILEADQPFLNSFSAFSQKYTNTLSDGWIGLNILNNAFSFKEVGLFSVHEQNLLLPNYSINFLCNYDEQPSVGGSLNVYQGHHGDLNAGRSDLILSSTSFMEKEAMYCNISGLVQKTRKILFGAGNLRDDWKIFNALLDFLGFEIDGIKGTMELKTLLSSISPFVLYKESSYGGFKTFINNQFILKFYGFTAQSDNFYLTDSVSRNSKIMSLCHGQFGLKDFSFLLSNVNQNKL